MIARYLYNMRQIEKINPNLSKDFMKGNLVINNNLDFGGRRDSRKLAMKVVGDLVNITQKEKSAVEDFSLSTEMSKL